MAYKRPAVTVIQEFIGLVPALAQFNLPTVVVGSAYQLVNNDNLGTYSGSLLLSAYASLMPGAQTDLEAMASDEMFPATKKPVTVNLTNAKIEILGTQANGSGNGTAFTDSTSSVFQNVQAGDKLNISAVTGLTILSPQTDGVTTNASGMRDRLQAGVAGEFADVKAGDTVAVTGGTNTTNGSYTVLVKIDDSNLKLSANVNDGVGPSTNVAYSITGDRGQNNEGSYIIRSKTDDNTLVLQGPLVEVESPITYTITRTIASISIPRATFAQPAGFTPEAGGISLPAGLTYTPAGFVGPAPDILEGTIIASYRALRNDLAASLTTYNKLSELQAAFGVDQITPQNPLAYGLSIQLQNTVTSVNGLGLDGNAASDETLSHQNAADVLALTDMYAIVPLSQNPATHQLWSAHATNMSADQKERIVILNRLLQDEMLMLDESTTSTSLSGARIIVNTQLDGSGALAQPSTVNDATSNQFNNVKAGDTLVVVGGTNANTGNFPVASIANANQLTVTGSIFTGTCTDLQYYIVRKDGIGADGIDFYDRNQTFITDGIAPGHLLRVMAGSYAGDYVITSVNSEHDLSVAQIPGVTSLVSAVDYEIVRNLTKTEQAQFIAGYSTSMGSRRAVMIWPDVVQAPVGTVLKDLPGYYAGCAVGAMVSGLPTQQGFTHLTISGFLGLKHSTGYFNDEQLDIIAGGGTFIFGQSGDQQPLFVRHQLTTDTSAIKFQELSVTKNVDFIAKFLRNTFAPFIGVYNIVDTTFDELRGSAKATITFLKDETRLPRIGGVIRSGSLTQLVQSTANIDTVLMTFSFDIPIPLNNLQITIQV